MTELLGILALIGSGTQITLTATKIMVDIGCQPMIRIVEPMLRSCNVSEVLRSALIRAATEVVERHKDDKDDRDQVVLPNLRRALSKCQ